MASCHVNPQPPNCSGYVSSVGCPIGHPHCSFDKTSFPKPRLEKDLRRFSDSLKRATNQFSSDNELLTAIIQVQNIVDARLTG